MGYVIQVQKKGQNQDWQTFPEKEYDELRGVKKYVNKQLTDVAKGMGALQVKVVKLERSQS